MSPDSSFFPTTIIPRHYALGRTRLQPHPPAKVALERRLAPRDIIENILAPILGRIPFQFFIPSCSVPFMATNTLTL
ncbi:hypothetical protein Moror_630 [Moniliophthora roreri MCA 2997]|uniref:Uncharacterized protein n=1 Tax=Moniliophthora roreri (strain MCA 2997) TaxID=1381753 RepID=V2WT12_MONRO|nr:hypothetical protein Moror_630 [Moniliophthora roreri MCA 2997]